MRDAQKVQEGARGLQVSKVERLREKERLAKKRQGQGQGHGSEVGFQKKKRERRLADMPLTEATRRPSMVPKLTIRPSAGETRIES